MRDGALHVAPLATLLRALNRIEREGVVQFAILAVLRADPGAIVSSKEMADWIWGDDPDGGPDDPAQNIHVTVRKLRRKGHPITRNGHRGYSYGP